ncbi:MAG TPA: DNA-formamidopyrimidine glycosylase family protein [Solirubrobacteraceae bacterium]|nr:DNA-formamidopyrimidine glycosylase family protein [Solirubrobacteraceae bacterium]
MPELPEVERARALIARRALGRRIEAVDDRDEWVCRPHTPGEIAHALTGATLTRAHRRGKTMWVETDADAVLGLHLGMAGRIVVDTDAEGDRPGRGEGDDGQVRDPHPRGWDRFALRFDDGGRLVLRDKRRLGRVRLDPDLSDLGPDAAEISRQAFRRAVGSGTAPVKARIMDQSAIAGVGNLLADETLWRARLDPQRPAGELGVEELDHLRRELRAATRSAIRHGGVHTGELIPARRRGGACPRCGAPMERATVGGRTTWWCPEEQR